MASIGSSQRLDLDSEADVEHFQKRMTQWEVDFETWPKGRQMAWKFLNHKKFDNVMGFIIVFNVILMLLESDKRAGCYPEQCDDAAIVNMNRFLLGIYTIEASIRGFVDRNNYFWSAWNILDFCIVTFGWMDEILIIATNGAGGGQALSILPMLRILRVARLLRAVKWIRLYPELYIMIRGFFGAMKAMFWGLVLIIVLLMFWSLIALEVINPINQEMLDAQDPDNIFCREAFGSVFNASLLFFQTLVAGDSWGACIVPIIKYNKPSFVLFAAALVCVSLGFMNLILAVIVDNATSARDSDKEEVVRQKKAEEAAAIRKWKDVIASIDEDKSGSISEKELLSAFEIPEVRHQLDVMGLDENDLHNLFKMLDQDGSGDLDYDEFINAFLKAQGQDLRIYLMMQKTQVDSMANTVRKLEAEVQSSLDIMIATLQGDDAAVPGGAPSSAPIISLDGDFKDIGKKLEEQFAILARSIQYNTMTISNNTKVLEEKVSPVKHKEKAKAPSHAPGHGHSQAAGSSPQLKHVEPEPAKPTPTPQPAPIEEEAGNDNEESI